VSLNRACPNPPKALLCWLLPCDVILIRILSRRRCCSERETTTSKLGFQSSYRHSKHFGCFFYGEAIIPLAELHGHPLGRGFRDSRIAINLMGTACGYTKVSSPEVARSAIKTLRNSTALRRALVLFNCYVDTLFVSIVPEHLKNHRILPRFFYRWEGELTSSQRIRNRPDRGLGLFSEKASLSVRTRIGERESFSGRRCLRGRLA
jgi:hypothetical protein